MSLSILSLVLLPSCDRNATTQPQQSAATASTENSPVDLARHRRAVEAVIWGMPAVNFDVMLEALIANGAKTNQMVYWSRPVNAKNQTLTPNPDTIYLNPFYDTAEGPMVLEIPPVDADSVLVGSVDNAGRRPSRM